MVNVFVIHGQQAAFGAIECIEMNAVVVHAQLCFLFGG